MFPLAHNAVIGRSLLEDASLSWDDLFLEVEESVAVFAEAVLHLVQMLSPTLVQDHHVLNFGGTVTCAMIGKEVVPGSAVTLTTYALSCSLMGCEPLVRLFGTTSNDAPFPTVKVIEMAPLGCRWLFMRPLRIDRTENYCTPARNSMVRAALVFAMELGNFCHDAMQQLAELPDVLGCVKSVYPANQVFDPISFCAKPFAVERMKESLQIALFDMERNRRVAVLLCCLARSVGRVLDVVSIVEKQMQVAVIDALGKRITMRDATEFFQHRYSGKSRAFACAVRPNPLGSASGFLSIEHDGLCIQTTAISHGPMALSFRIDAATRINVGGEATVHGYLAHYFHNDDDKWQQLKLCLCSRPYSSVAVIVGRITSNSEVSLEHCGLVANGRRIDIPLDLDVLPSSRQFHAAISSLSLEQQEFSSQIRSHQLAETLFCVIAIPIRPLIEQALGLPDAALEKEIALCDELLQLVTLFNVPLDVLAGRDVNAVLENVKAFNSFLDRALVMDWVKNGNVRQLAKHVSRFLSFCRSDPLHFRQLVKLASDVGMENFLADNAKEFDPEYYESLKASVIFDEVKRGNVQKVEFFVSRRGVPINYRDEATENTPLIVACKTDQTQVARYLVEKGANINAQNLEGRTALHEVVENNFESLALWLIRKGADIYVEDKRTYSPYDLALPDFKREMKRIAADVEVTKRYEVSEAKTVGLYSSKQYCATGSDDFWTRHAEIQAQLPRGMRLGKMPMSGRNEDKTCFKEEPNQVTNNREACHTSSGVGFLSLPAALEAALENAPFMRPCILRVEAGWDKDKRRRNECVDLLEALSKSGVVTLDHAEIHIVHSSCHVFAENCIDCIVRSNVDLLDVFDNAVQVIQTTIADVCMNAREN